MYRVVIFLSFLLYSYCCYSQQSPPVTGHTLPSNLSYQNASVPSRIIDPATGKIFQNNSLPVTGSPFFSDDWKYSFLKLKDGRTYDMVRAKINLVTDEIYFKATNDVEMVLYSGNVTEINVYTTPESKIIEYKFQTGFPKIDNHDQISLYEVVAEGNIKLLKRIRKKLSVSKNDVSGETNKEFISYEEYYVIQNNKIRRLKREKDFVVRLLSDKKERIEQYIEQNSTNFKNMSDVELLFKYYNSLFLP